MWPSSGRPLDGLASSGLWPSSGRTLDRSRLQFRDSSGEGDPGRFEHVFAALASDGTEAAVLETQEAMKGARGNEVGHLELPAELAGRGLLVTLRDARDVRRVPHQMQDAHRPFRAAQAEDHLVGRILPRGLYRHLAGLEQMGNGVGHGRAEELAGRGMRVVEVPAARRVYPELRVLPEGGGNAAAPFDEYRTARSELGQAEARAGEPQRSELAQVHGL